MAGQRTPAQLLRRLEVLAGRITKSEASTKADYAERLELWEEAIEQKVDRAEIARASGVGDSAIRAAFHAKRKRGG